MILVYSSSLKRIHPKLVDNNKIIALNNLFFNKNNKRCKNKHPVFLVNGIGAAQIYAKGVGETEHCAYNFNNEKNIWLQFKSIDGLKIKSYFGIERQSDELSQTHYCIPDLLKLDYNDVDQKPIFPKNLTSGTKFNNVNVVNDLSETHVSIKPTFYYGIIPDLFEVFARGMNYKSQDTQIYTKLIENLTMNGAYRKDYDIIGAAYDWRFFDQDTYFQSLSKLINEKCEKKGSVVIISHSMGGIVMYRFFRSNYFNDKVKNCIHEWISVNTPFAGSPLIIEALISGIKFGFSYLKKSEMKELIRSMDSTFQLLPSKKIPIWRDSNFGFAQRGKTNYSSLDYSKLWEDLFQQDINSINRAKAFTNRGMSESGLMNATNWIPPIPYRCVFSELGPESTPLKIMYNENFGKLDMYNGHGDGTVPRESLKFGCEIWDKNPKIIKKETHTDVLKNQEFIEFILEQVCNYS